MLKKKQLETDLSEILPALGPCPKYTEDTRDPSVLTPLTETLLFVKLPLALTRRSEVLILLCASISGTKPSSLEEHTLPLKNFVFEDCFRRATVICDIGGIVEGGREGGKERRMRENGVRLHNTCYRRNLRHCEQWSYCASSAWRWFLKLASFWQEHPSFATTAVIRFISAVFGFS